MSALMTNSCSYQALALETTFYVYATENTAEWLRESVLMTLPDRQSTFVCKSKDIFVLLTKACINFFCCFTSFYQSLLENAMMVVDSLLQLLSNYWTARVDQRWCNHGSQSLVFHLGLWSDVCWTRLQDSCMLKPRKFSVFFQLQCLNLDYWPSTRRWHWVRISVGEVLCIRTYHIITRPASTNPFIPSEVIHRNVFTYVLFESVCLMQVWELNRPQT